MTTVWVGDDVDQLRPDCFYFYFQNASTFASLHDYGVCTGMDAPSPNVSGGTLASMASLYGTRDLTASPRCLQFSMSSERMSHGRTEPEIFSPETLADGGDAVRNLRDVMPTIGVVLVQHASLQKSETAALLPHPFIDLPVRQRRFSTKSLIAQEWANEIRQ